MGFLDPTQKWGLGFLRYNTPLSALASVRPATRQMARILAFWTAAALVALFLAISVNLFVSPDLELSLPSSLLHLLKLKLKLLRLLPLAHPQQRLPPSSSDEGAYSERPPCVLWMAPFLSGGGYSSEAWSYVSALNSTAGRSRISLRIDHHGDLDSLEFWLGLPAELQHLAYKLHATQCAMAETVVVCHSEPGAWYPPLFQTTPCPPAGYDGPMFVIGRTMFETDRLIVEHVERCNRMDAVWVPTGFHVSTFVASGVHADKVVKMVQPIDVLFFNPSNHEPLPLPNEDPVLNSNSNLGRREFVFLSIFKWEHRKGWDVLLKAFLAEFSGAEGVALYLLINAYHSDKDFAAKIKAFVSESGLEEPLIHGWPPIHILDFHLPQAELPRLYKAADAFVLPSRGEGWGRPIVEAMAMELPVIATNWSGPTEYLTEDNGYPLPVDSMSEVMEGPFKGHRWAEPSSERLRVLMRHVMRNPEESRSKGRKARHDMIQKFSPDVVAELVIDQIMEIAAKKKKKKQSSSSS